MTHQELELRLAHAKIVRALTYPALRRVVRRGRLVRVPENQIIIGPKLGGTSAYVVLEGSIEMVMPWGPVLARLGPGELFGEVALLHHSERSAYWKASTESLLFEIPFYSFHGDLLANHVVRAGLEEAALARRAIEDALSGVRRAPAPAVATLPSESGAPS